MSILLGPHVIGMPPQLADFLRATNPGVIKYLVDYDKPPPFFAPITIGRIHEISEQKDLAQPLVLARAHADALTKCAEQTRITLWEGINEPPIWGDGAAEYIKRLCDYENERVRLLNERGLFAVVLNLNVGWPRELADGVIDWQPFESLLAHLARGNMLGDHEYWLPGGPNAPDSLHCRAGRVFRCPYHVPIVITECGVDTGGNPHTSGWRAHGLTAAQYAGQLRQYADLMSQDPRVKGATIFTFGGDWPSFQFQDDWPFFTEVCKGVAHG